MADHSRRRSGACAQRKKRASVHVLQLPSRQHICDLAEAVRLGPVMLCTRLQRCQSRAAAVASAALAAAALTSALPAAALAAAALDTAALTDAVPSAALAGWSATTIGV